MDTRSASPRVPYRAASTPPPNYRGLHSHSPARHHRSSRPGTAGSEYPEQPTAYRPLQEEGHAKPSPFALGQAPPAKWRLPKAVRSPKRLLSTLVALAILGLLIKYVGMGKDRLLRSKWGWRPRGGRRVDDGLCRFVSPVDAYHRDLQRLRGLAYPGANLTALYPSLHSYVHHHTYSPTGHLLVSDHPDAPHPIPLLLDLGEKRWEELLSRQSRTLEEAVREYMRRYGRRPPRGFDKWWDFAMRHNLVLPDEYDRINLDLAPFLALPEEEMKRRRGLVDNMSETFTLVIKNGSVDIEIKDEGGLNWGGTLPRASDTAALLRAFSEHLPDMRATFSIFDQPQIYLSWARRGSLVNLGLKGEHTSHLEETDSALVKLSRSCAPDSNYRKNESYSEGRSFIYDSLEAGDLCQNPYVIPIHGLTIEPHEPSSHPRPHTQLLPLFSLAKTSINSDILITPLDQFNHETGKDLEFRDKPSSRLAWRGSPTGISWMNAQVDWRNAHRIRLHRYANNRSTEHMTFLVPDFGQDEDYYPDEFDVDGGIAEIKNGQEEWHERNREVQEQHLEEQIDEGPLHFIEEEIPTDEAMEFFYDIKLAGDPIQCDSDDGTCDDLRREIEWAPRQSGEDLNQNKFLLDIDGNGWSGRFRKLMSTNSAVIKMTMFTEWFQPHLIPWFMYIPAKLDFSDLPDIMAFFRGSPTYPEFAFDETAEALAINGKCFVQRMFRLEDMQAYMMRLFLEYARIAADEGDDMDFYLDDYWSDIDTSDWFDEEAIKNRKPVADLPDVMEGDGGSRAAGTVLEEELVEGTKQDDGGDISWEEHDGLSEEELLREVV
ncbi:hypothetical protein L198_01851 [Cryptococcus wingfieldii CBS 7118]|uniref:Glycosyl transferase CAP10 domain-containing protein n=1 Tax=Cryptococcus wingfieldii CBS 7118 TaxID=1295528 RepID=A0A1E3JWI9_9TREE|nr:hypothetical protein L198_01851 [Cryptococcus wingfieldii CBS 7118]ODO05163.1 hypothetical protein L198_01851 [Cryptococcus wingfieldii CBS 7118]